MNVGFESEPLDLGDPDSCLASLGLSASYSFPVLMVFMGLGGFGGGWFHPQSLAILSEKYRAQKAFALGVHDSSANLGEVIGPLAIGLLLNVFDWRVALVLWAIPGLVVGAAYALAGSEGALAVPRARDYRKAIWNDVLKNKTVCGLVAVSTLRAMGQTALASFLPLYLLLHLGLPAAEVGAYMSILYLCAGVAPALVGWVSDRIGHRYLIVLFSFLSVAMVAAIPHLGSGMVLGTLIPRSLPGFSRCTCWSGRDFSSWQGARRGECRDGLAAVAGRRKERNAVAGRFSPPTNV